MIETKKADEFNEIVDNNKSENKKEIAQLVRKGICTASVSETDHRIAVQQTLNSIETELSVIRFLLVKILIKED